MRKEGAKTRGRKGCLVPVVSPGKARLLAEGGCEQLGEWQLTQDCPGHVGLFSEARPAEGPGMGPEANLVLVRFPFRKSSLFLQ